MRDLLELLQPCRELGNTSLFHPPQNGRNTITRLKEKNPFTAPCLERKKSHVYESGGMLFFFFLKTKDWNKNHKEGKKLSGISSCRCYPPPPPPKNINSLLPWNSIWRNVHQKTLASARTSMELNILHSEAIKVRRVYIIGNEGNTPSPSLSRTRYMDMKVAVSSQSFTAFCCCYKGKLQRQISSLKTKFLFSSTRPPHTHMYKMVSGAL